MNLPAAIDPGPATCPLVFIPAVSQEPVYAQMPAGQTLAQMLGADAAHSIRVMIGGHVVPREIWHRLRPKAGTRIVAEFWPQGGGARKWVLTVVAIVATIYSFGAASGAAWATVGGLSASTVAIGGAVIAGLALAMIPPPMSKIGGAGGDPLDQLRTITGTQNNINPYGAIPLVVGSWRFYPTHAANPYTEIVGNDQYMRMLLDLGHGDLDVSDIRIGNTPIEEFDGVEYEVSTEPKLFNQDIFELQVGTALKASGDSDVRTTQEATTEISLDIVFPNGFCGTNSKGNASSGTTSFTIEYRPTGTSDAWSNAASAAGLGTVGGYQVTGGAFKLTRAERRALRTGIRWRVASGQYDVRVTRGASSYPDSVASTGDAAWAVLRSINPQLPSTTGTLKLAVRIKATDQLSGVVSTLSVRAAQRVRRWDKANQAWLAPVATANCAWVYLWLLTECPGLARHLPVASVDLDRIADWAADCETFGFTFGTVVDAPRVSGDLFKDVLACGLASPGWRNGKHGVVRDIAQTVPMQTYTPVNSAGFRWERTFAEPPHALRVRFTNPSADNQQDERLVYWDGYSKANATHIEVLDLRNVSSPDAAWRIARYHLAVMWHRPVTYTVPVDIEHLVNERGDLVEVAQPMIGWGVSCGFLREVDSSGTILTLAEPFAVEAGKTYALRLRLGNAYSSSSNLSIDPDDIVDGKTHRVTLSDAIANIKAGQLYVVGEVGSVTRPVVITAIKPGSNMLQRTATLSVVDAAPEVWTAWTGEPPPFVSSINGKPWCAAPEPPVVSIRAGNSAPDDAGVIHAQVGVAAAPKPGIHRMPLPARYARRDWEVA